MYKIKNKVIIKRHCYVNFVYI